MLQQALGISVRIALDQHDQRVRPDSATAPAGDFLDTLAGDLLGLERDATKEPVGAVVGDELKAPLRRGGADDGRRALHRLWPGLAVVQREVLAMVGDAVVGPQAFDQP